MHTHKQHRSKTSDAQVEDEVVVGENFYFHTASQHGSTNRQVVSTVTEMESDKSLFVYM